jgi:cytochrome c
MVRRFILSVVAASIVVLGPAGTAIAQRAPSQQGYAIADRLCARCHAIGREGASPMGIAPPFRELPQRYPVEMLAESLAEGIVTGHPAMPRFTLHPREIDALLTYIDSLAPANRKKGR